MQATEYKRAVHQAAVLEPFVPEPTAEFHEALRARQVRTIPTPLIPIPIPMPLQFGSRFLIWKQDPSVTDLGRRLVFLDGLVLNGPRDARITTVLSGTTPVARNADGDFIFHVADAAEADCAHTFAVIRASLTMYERLLGGTPIRWAWNVGGNTDVISAHPRAGVTPNAYYSRGQKALKFFYFTPTATTTPVFTCRSFDIVAHEAGHAILDGLKPGWLGFNNPPQTGALHESFGDLTAVFLALSQLDQVEAFIAMSKANLHAKNFLAAVAEQFGAALGQPVGLRNADNDLTLAQVSNQVHSLSQVFTGGIYDVLADVFAYERHRQRATKDPAQVLLEVSQHVGRLFLQGIRNAPATAATFADVVNAMLVQSHAQGDAPVYRNFIRNRFTFRGVVVSATPLTGFTTGELRIDDPRLHEEDDMRRLELADPMHPSLVATQDRSECCGTMHLPEYYQDRQALEHQLHHLQGAGNIVTPEMQLATEIEQLSKAFA